MEFRIEIDRPVTLLITLAGIIAGIVMGVSWLEGGATHVQANAVGGTEEVNSEVALASEEEIRRERREQAVLEHREEILRFQIRNLETQRRHLSSSDPDIEEQYRMSVRLLVELLANKARSEERMLASFRQLWEAEDRSLVYASKLPISGKIAIAWPLDPIYGISAEFMDLGYRAIFGFDHKAIDIPTEQETPVLAAADGIVKEVVDNGLGYSWIAIEHKGFVTVYGHVQNAHVEPGRYVWQGDLIADSSGMPGAPGSGDHSTGPHLHFELITQVGHVDPLQYLPERDLPEWES